MRPGSEPLFVGLMSGTSADGIDAALVRFHGEGPHARPELLAARTCPWPDALQRQLVTLGQQDIALPLDAVAELDVRIGQEFAAAANALLADAPALRGQVAAIGSHGQTLRHRPRGEAPFSLQLGDANIIAERCRLPVVADFRRRDVAAGGQGAPLVPAFHAAVLHDAGEDRAVLNLGGIANLTLLPAEGRVRGFDTGPANGLMDAWCLHSTGHPFDDGGKFAAAGQCDAALLERLLDEPWFALPPPKSTGRDQFHLPWLQARLSGAETPADVQATLLALSVRTIAAALEATQPRTARLLACGGGVRNPVLMRALAAALPGLRVGTTAAHGLDADFVEAIAFAWLAREHLAGRPGNLPAVTGAAGPRVLGALFPG